MFVPVTVTFLRFVLVNLNELTGGLNKRDLDVPFMANN